MLFMITPIHLLIIVVVLLVVYGITYIGKGLFRFFKFSSVQLRKSESLWLVIFGLILVLFTGISEYVKFSPKFSIITILGLLLFSAGVIFQFYLIKQNKDFVLKKALKTEITGIFKKIRFPGYSALMIMLLGLSILFESMWAVAIFVILFFPAVMYRMAQEEALLSDIDEDKFELYASESDRLIPKIY